MSPKSGAVVGLLAAGLLSHPAGAHYIANGMRPFKPDESASD
jgi:hypothetical protein